MRFLGARWSEEMDSCLAKMSDRIQTFFFFEPRGAWFRGIFKSDFCSQREKKKKKSKPGNLEVDKKKS